ncbi:MAG: hypothetical protein ACYS1C_01710 [Planctomycetota bacterium]|jgi:KaiC/GvpD/RAD55 family RecA-like ATPase
MGSEQPGSGDAGSKLARLVGVARERPALTLALLICLAAAAYVAATSLVATERGRLLDTIDEITRALEQGDAEGVISHVSPYFSEEGMSRRSLARNVKHILARKPLTRLKVSVRRLDPSAPRAAATVHVVSYLRADYRAHFARSEWRLTFEKIDGSWYVRTASPIHINGRRVAGLRSVLALGF